MRVAFSESRRVRAQQRRSSTSGLPTTIGHPFYTIEERPSSTNVSAGEDTKSSWSSFLITVTSLDQVCTLSEVCNLICRDELGMYESTHRTGAFCDSRKLLSSRSLRNHQVLLSPRATLIAATMRRGQEAQNY
jgi:hypothetical protein